jgi:capsular exopolysaccharide synthesis family protein
MSRIFDALQRSGVEQSGVEYPDVLSVITEVLEAPRELEPVATETTVQAEPVPVAAVVQADAVPVAVVESPPDELVTQKQASQELSEFPALNVSVPSSSRLAFFTEPDSLAAEKLRFLGVRLRQIQQNRPLKKVLVTSTIPEEGKSFISANLAGVLARRKQKVLLIDGDLRRPTLAQQFGLGRLAGLGGWLQGDHRKLSNIYRLNGPDFWLMPAGDPPSNPLELMQSGSLSQLMGQLAALFDWIIVDSPPFLPLADTTVWSRMTDGTLLVAREGKTQKAMLERCFATIKKSELLGVVLNGCTDLNAKSYYQSYLVPGTNRSVQQLP